MKKEKKGKKRPTLTQSDELEAKIKRLKQVSEANKQRVLEAAKEKHQAAPSFDLSEVKRFKALRHVIPKESESEGPRQFPLLNSINQNFPKRIGIVASRTMLC